MVVKTNLTPPEKTRKVAKSPTAKDGEKKPRAPRKDYGYAKGATIHLTDGEKNYRGHRQAWYEHLKACNGKTVEAFSERTKDEKEGARGWLRFFVENEACTLKAPPAPPADPAAK